MVYVYKYMSPQYINYNRAHARAHAARALQWLAELARATHLHGNDAEIKLRREGGSEGGGGKRAEVREERR